MTIVSTSFAKSERIQWQIGQKDPVLPARVLDKFGSLVTELVNQNFGEVSYDVSIEWIYEPGQWLARATITITRSTGIDLTAYFRPSGQIISYEYFIH